MQSCERDLITSHGDFVKEQAMVSYFTGNYELLPRTRTVLGTVAASRIVHTSSFGTVNDTPYISIDFDDAPTTVEGAWGKMREVRQFFAWMMGYAPAWKDVVVFTSSSNDDAHRVDGHLDRGFEAFGPSEWQEVSESDRDYGTLIDASQHAEHFMAVMGKWLERNRDGRRRSANIRYFGSLQGMNRRVMEDGIVSAANAFDLLPSRDKPSPVPLNPSLAAIMQDARERVRKRRRRAPKGMRCSTAWGGSGLARRFAALFSTGQSSSWRVSGPTSCQVSTRSFARQYCVGTITRMDRTRPPGISWTSPM